MLYDIDVEVDAEILDESDFIEEGDCVGITDGVKPVDAVRYVEYDIEAVFEGELDVLIEFVFEGLLEANGVFDTLCVVDKDPHGDTDTLGLKLTVELADGHDEPIRDPDRPDDTDIRGD